MSAAAHNVNKKLKIENCAPVTNCITKINNIQVNDDHDVEAEIPMYNLKQYSDIYSKTSGNLWQYYRD